MPNSALHFPNPSTLLGSDGWLASNQLPGQAPARALQYPGLMTHAVLTLLGFEPRIIKQRNESGDALRRVAFYAGDQLFLLAISQIPVPMLLQHPWLRKLGDTPLGEAIERHAGVQRNDFEILPVSAGTDLATNFGSLPTWARRYHFELPDGQITVMELFNPELLEQLESLMPATN